MTVDYFFLVRILLSYGRREAGQFAYFPLHATKQNPFHDARRSSAANRNPGTIQEISNIYFIAFQGFLPFVFSVLPRTQQLPSADVAYHLLHAGESTLNYRELKEVLIFALKVEY